GNGADDIIDGDKWLNVRLSVRDAQGTEIKSVTTLKDIQADIMAGKIDPGNVFIVREILNGGTSADVDTANFSGARAEYDITTANGVTTVAHVRGSGDDGTDTITNVERLRFTDQTVDLTDTTAPTVTDRTPAANATNVVTNSNITATFSEPVTGVDANTFRVTNSAGTAVTAAVSYDAATRTATLNPNANLLADRTYTVQLTNGIQDLQGNALPATTWNFTTAGPAPSVTGRTPAANATNVATNSNITATFSEPVTGVNATTFRVTNSAGTAVTAAVSYDAATRTATLNPNANLLADRTYTVQLTNGIRDLQGNALPATTWNFTTAGPAPSVTGRTPAANARNVVTNSNITATFSEPVTGVNATTFRVTNSAGTAVTAAVSYDAA